MPTQDFVDVRLYIDGHTDPVLELPDEGVPDTEDVMTRYIEVKAGQKWTVRVRVLENFRLRYAPQLYAHIQVDGNEYVRIGQKSTQGVKHTKGYLQQVVEVAHFEDDFGWNDAKGEWAHFSYCFGALGFTEDNSLPAGSTVDDVQAIGTIRVRFYRAKKVQRSEAFIIPTKQPKALDELPEKFLKGSEIKANTKLVNPRPAKAPEPRLWEMIPIEGKHGKIFEFVFKYRTRKALQNLGIIERSLSPSPDLSLQLERANAENEEFRRENKLLRARLRSGSLASSVTLKAEPNASDNIRSRHGGTSLKREREEDADDVVEVAPPPKKPRVIIDLTVDD